MLTIVPLNQGEILNSFSSYPSYLKTFLSSHPCKICFLQFFYVRNLCFSKQVNFHFFFHQSSHVALKIFKTKTADTLILKKKHSNFTTQYIIISTIFLLHFNIKQNIYYYVVRIIYYRIEIGSPSYKRKYFTLEPIIIIYIKI